MTQTSAADWYWLSGRTAFLDSTAGAKNAHWRTGGVLLDVRAICEECVVWDYVTDHTRWKVVDTQAVLADGHLRLELLPQTRAGILQFSMRRGMPNLTAFFLKRAEGAGAGSSARDGGGSSLCAGARVSAGVLRALHGANRGEAECCAGKHAKA